MKVEPLPKSTRTTKSRTTTKRSIIEISPKTILLVIAAVVLLGFLFYVRDIIFLVFLALIFAAAIDQPIDWLDRRGVPRALGVIFIYLVFLALLAVSVAIIIPPIAEQVRALAESLPDIFEKVGIAISTSNGEGLSQNSFSNVQAILESLGNSFARSTSDGLFSTLGNIFGGFFSIALVMVLTFYLVVRENGLKRFARSLVPVKNRPYVTSLTNRVQYKIGLWFRGQIVLGFIIFVLSYIGLKLLGVEYALVLAIAAGVLEIVPYIGPIIAAIPAVFLAFGDDPIKAVLVVVLYVVLQQLENQILVPKIMQKAVGLNPVIVIVALLIGAKVAGVVGLLLAIPIATAIAEFSKDFLNDDVSLEDATPEKVKR